MKDTVVYCGKAVLFSLVMAGVVPGLLGQNAFAKEKRVASINGTSIELIIPSGYCTMKQSQPVDRGYITQMKKVFSKGHKVLSFFADCKELADWRKGRRQGIENSGTIITPLIWIGQKFDMPRREFGKKICAVMSKEQGEQSK